MAQSTILAAGTTVATSSNVVVGTAGAVSVGLFVASGDIPADCSFVINDVTPGATVPIGSLNKQIPIFTLPYVGTFTVTRNSVGGAGTSVGVYLESTGAGSAPTEGNVASGATDSGNPVKIGGVFRTTQPTLTDGQRGDIQLNSRGAPYVVMRGPNTSDGPVNTLQPSTDAQSTGNVGLFTISANHNFDGTNVTRQRGDTVATSVLPGLSSTFWNYPAAASGIVNTTTAVTVKAAAGASVRNYISALQLSWGTLGAATEFAIRDGAAGTVLWRVSIGTAAGSLIMPFPVPLRGTANTLVEVVTLTASVTGAVYANLQGFTGA